MATKSWRGGCFLQEHAFFGDAAGVSPEARSDTVCDDTQTSPDMTTARDARQHDSLPIVAAGTLRNAAANCRECPLGERATQTVWGKVRANHA